MMRDEIEKLVREHINEWYADWSRQEVEVPRLAAALHAAWGREEERYNAGIRHESERADAAEARLEQEEVYRKMAEEERDQLAARVREESAIVDRVWKALEISTYEDAKGKAIDEIVADLKTRLAALREAADKARRETASDPENRWCRNATILLNAALAAEARREGA